MARLEGAQPSGCTFWSIASEGRVFYTAPEDHYNCPIGSYTHHIPLPKEREHELTDTLSLMSDLGYIRMAEVPLSSATGEDARRHGVFAAGRHADRA